MNSTVCRALPETITSWPGGFGERKMQTKKGRRMALKNGCIRRVRRRFAGGAVAGWGLFFEHRPLARDYAEGYLWGGYGHAHEQNEPARIHSPKPPFSIACSSGCLWAIERQFALSRQDPHVKCGRAWGAFGCQCRA